MALLLVSALASLVAVGVPVSGNVQENKQCRYYIANAKFYFFCVIAAI
jgi:hypothetical protein